MNKVIGRSPMVNLQLYRAVRNGVDASWILVGLDGAESYRLGPYDATPSIEEALSLVAIDMRLDHNKFGDTVKIRSG